MYHPKTLKTFKINMSAIEENHASRKRVENLKRNNGINTLRYAGVQPLNSNKKRSGN